ncbi:hypothetical protein [Paludibacterium purpuratum]|uniref:Uncharacterized protein n=1 Tax=Paludibacterium purpuratum TaxID=1144873 RepID=A0A4R7B6B0_9NEIS|nr:hypothetical protein [Paludibacterium purpuratum]TDR79983.1 hypothetical protein DFP86_106123 [Paludibacterium purpuratum]
MIALMTLLRRYWREVVLLLVVIGVLLIGWSLRGIAAERDTARQADLQDKARLAQIQRQDAVTQRIDASATATAEHTQTVYRTLHDEVIQYVDRKDSSASCMLDLGWVRLHDAAANGIVPDASGTVDASRP